MALAKQTIQIPFAQGLDTKTSAPSVDKARLLVAQNVIFSRPGELSKRNGGKKLGAGGGGPNTAAFMGSLGQFDGELAMIGNAALRSYDAANDTWINKGALRSPRVTTKGIYSDPNGQQHPDCCTAGGVTLYAWEEVPFGGILSGSGTAGIYASLVDEATGAVISPPHLLPLGSNGQSNPHCVVAGNFLFVFYATNDGGTARSIRWGRTTIGQPGVWTTGTLVSGTLISSIFSVKSDGGGSLVVAYSTNTTITCSYVTQAGALQALPAAITIALAGSICTALNVLIAQGAIWVLYATSNGGVFLPIASVYDQATLAILGGGALTGASEPTLIKQVTGAVDGAAFRMFYEVFNTVTYNTVVRTLTFNANLSVIGAISDLRRSVGLASDAFTDATFGGALVWLTYDDTTQPTYFCCDGGGVILAKALQNYGAGLSAQGFRQLPQAQQLPGKNAWAIALGTRTRFVSEAGQVTFYTSGVSRVTLDFSSEQYLPAQLGQNLHIGGGLLSGYDGVTLFEDGFNVYPPAPSVSSSTVGLAITTAGHDAKNVQVSAVSLPPDDTTVQPVVPCGARIRPGQYFLWFDADTPVAGDPFCLYVWFTVDGVGTDPALGTPAPPAGTVASVKVAIASTSNRNQVCLAMATAINAALASNGSNAGHTSLVYNDPLSADAASGVSIQGLVQQSMITTLCADTQMGYDVIQAGTGTVTEIDRLLFPAGQWLTGGEWFLLESSFRNATTILTNPVVQVYFVRTDMPLEPTTPQGPAPTVAATLAVNILSTYTAQQVAAAVSAALVAFRLFTVQIWTTTLWGPAVDVKSVVATSAPNFTPLNTTASGGIRNFSTGGSMNSGTRLYVLTYEWTDARGQFHTSSPSRPFTALTAETKVSNSQTLPAPTAPNNQTVNAANVISAPTYRLTKRANVQIGVWRSTPTELGGGAVFARVATLANDPTVDTVTVQDAASDLAIGSADKLYTSTGELANIGPPPAQAVVQHRNRAWLVGLDDGNLILPSKEWVPGYAVAWADPLEMGIRIDQAGGAVVGAASMDSYFVVFKQQRILVIEGDGPDATGGNGQFNRPRIVNTDVGCVSQDSIVFTDAGVVFMAPKGLCLLTRDLRIEYIGAPVEAFTVGNLVSSAVLIPDQSRIRFATDAGVTLVYDLNAGQWATFTYGSEHATYWNGLYTRVDDTGAVWQDTPNVFTDNGIPVAVKVQTAWFKPGDVLQGFMRARRMQVVGKYLSSHSLQVEVCTDYDETVRQTVVFNAATIVAADVYGAAATYGADAVYGANAPGPALEEFGVHIMAGVQKCEAIRFTITEVPQDAGAGLTLLGLALECGVKQGLRTLPATRSA